MSIFNGVMEFWHWWALALLFAGLEMLLPGVFFLWLALAAVFMGGLLLGFPDLTWQVQVLWFSFFSIGSFLGSRLYLWKNPIQTRHPTLNRRGEQYLGRVFTLQQPIVNNYGHICVDDSTWKIHGPDLAAGEKVRLTAINGVIFEVERV